MWNSFVNTGKSSELFPSQTPVRVVERTKTIVCETAIKEFIMISQSCVSAAKTKKTYGSPRMFGVRKTRCSPGDAYSQNILHVELWSCLLIHSQNSVLWSLRVLQVFTGCLCWSLQGLIRKVSPSYALQMIGLL